MKRILTLIFILIKFSSFSQKSEKLDVLFSEINKFNFKYEKLDSLIINQKNALFFQNKINNEDTGIKIISYYDCSVLKMIDYIDSTNHIKITFYLKNSNNYYFITCFYQNLNQIKKGFYVNGFFIYKESQDYICFFEINENKIINNNDSIKISKELTANDINKIFKLNLDFNPTNRIILYKGQPLTFSVFLNPYTEDVRIYDQKSFKFKPNNFLSITWEYLWVILNSPVGNTILRFKTQNELEGNCCRPIWSIYNRNYLW